MKFLCEQCKAKYQIADDKAAGKTVRMKCRKCGHLIEVRATATDSAPPPAAAPAAPARPAAPKAPQRPAPAPPRAGALASSLGAAKPAKVPERSGGALAGAFKSAVQREEESSAPFDMDDLSPSDEWYVAINGVPVGPIRIAEVRRKAALGAVTEESLCWQEGLDEWRPVRAFPELAAIVREAAASGRSSLPPSAPEGRSSGVGVPGGARASRPPQAPAAAAPRPPARPAPVAARSNVVPITSRLATAERLDDDDLEGATRMQPGIAQDAGVVADPFANPPAPAPAPAAMTAQMAPVMATGQHVAAEPSIAAPAPRKSPPWMAIAMVAAAVAFGVTAALALVLRPAAPPPAPVVVQMPGAPVPAAPTTAAPTPTATATDTTNPDVPGVASGAKGPIAMGGPPKPGASAPPTATTASKGPLDLGGLGGSGPRPGEDPGGGDAPKAPGQCFSSAQVSQVIGLHQPGIRRSCWERNPTTKPTVNVNVSLTIGPDGSPQSVSASADELTVAKCVENDVRTWCFPSMGCSQQTSFSFHFVRQ